MCLKAHESNAAARRSLAGAQRAGLECVLVVQRDAFSASIHTGASVGLELEGTTSSS